MRIAWISLIFILSSELISVFSQEAITYRTINITVETSEPTQLQLNQGRLIWKDKDPGSGKFNLKYFSGAEIFRLDSELLGLTSAIDGEYIAWNTTAEEIKLFNVKDWTTQPIGSSFNPDGNQPISIANSKIAYARSKGSGSEIVVMDLLTGGETTFSEGVWNLEPSIDHGQLAWTQKFLADTTLSNIYFYDGQTTRLLSNTGNVKNSHPVLKDGEVIWVQIQGSAGSVKLFDGDSVLTLIETGPDEIISGYDLSNGIAVASITDTISDNSEVNIYNAETKSFLNIVGYKLISGLHIDNGLIVYTSGIGADMYLRLCYVNTGLIEEWGGAESPVVDDGQIAWTLGDGISLMIPITTLQLSSGVENGWPQSRFKDNEGERVIWGNIDNSLTARLFYNDGNTTVQLTDSSVYKDFIMMNDGYAIWRHDFTSLYLYDGINPPELIIDSLQCENIYLADGSIGFHGFRSDAGNNVNQAWIYRINTDSLIQLTFDDSVNVMNTFTLVDDDNACWYRDSSGISMLMLYDGISKRRLTDSAVYNEFGFREGKIIWSESRNGIYQIMLYNLQTMNKKQLTDGPNNTYRPETDGSVAVWLEDTPSGTIMWYYDIASEMGHKVAYYNPRVSRWLRISNGKIAWSSNWEVCVYDGNRISRLTNSAPYYPNKEPYVDHDVVVWNKNNPDPNVNHYGQVFLAKLHAHVDFDAENITGNAPLTVSFFNNSFQGVRSYHWDFGDGQTSTDKDPVHLYQEPGVYSVTLTAEGLTGPAPEKKINLVRVSQLTSTEEKAMNHPVTCRLYQNFPNPFSLSTAVPFELSEPLYVSLHVYDLLGNEVATLVDENLPAGYHEVLFNGAQLSGGIYIVRFRAGNYAESKILNLIR